MPFYDYKCEKCDHLFEEMLKVADRKKPERKKCPGCGASGCVKQHISGGTGMAIDTNHRVDGNATGAFKDVMERVIQSDGIRGSKREKYYRTRWGM
jgi:putative FmdB family regulatory protein